MEKNRKIITDLFKKNYSPYRIHLETGFNIKEVYHHLRQDEELRHRHEEIVKKRRKENPCN